MATPRRPRVQAPSVLSGEQRINKLLAAAGLGSRRQVDELIQQGRVEIDGKTISQVGVKVDVNAVKISVDGEPLKRHRPVYFAVHKPAGVLCTNRDPEGRPRVIDLVPGNQRLFPVGRLDASSTGLILLTNDGELAQRLAHPRHSVPKNYFVVVAGQVEADAMRRLQRGIYLAEGLARVDGAKIRKVRKGCTEIDITLSEGKNREIRRVLARLGHRVVTLRRTGIGPLRLANMPEGGFRPLTPAEVADLYQAVEDIKREKKNNRKEREQRRAEEMAGLEQEPSATQQSSPAHGQSSSVEAKSNRKSSKSKRSASAVSSQEHADDSFESLPPLANNPFHTEEDIDDEPPAELEAAVLVREAGPAIMPSAKKGKVLGYDTDDEPIESSRKSHEAKLSSDDDALASDDMDADFLAALPSDDFDSDFDDEDGDEMFGDDVPSLEDVPSSSPWSRAKPKHLPSANSQHAEQERRGRSSRPQGNASRRHGSSATRGRSSSAPGARSDSRRGARGGKSKGSNTEFGSQPADSSRENDSRGRRAPSSSRSRFGNARAQSAPGDAGTPRSGRPSSRGAKRGGKPGFGSANRKGTGGKGRPPKKR